MKTYKPEPGQLMSWGDVKEWLDSMDEKELAQPAYIYREEFGRQNGWSHTTEEQIVGTKTKTLNTGFETPRLIGETYKED